MSDLKHYKPNELEMALKIAKKAIDSLIEEKPNGGLVVNKGQDIEAKMSYQKAKMCLERVQTKFSLSGAFSFGICGECSYWTTDGHYSVYDDCGGCKLTKKSTHRYYSCPKHSEKNGGWGL